MEKHKCKLCSKSFVNGRALGGHMRSHMLNLPIQPKNPDEEEEHPGQLGAEPTESASSHSSFSSDDEEEEKRVLMADHEFSSSLVLQDRESETESSKNPTRKRSRRNRKLPGYISLGQQNCKEEAFSEKMKTMKLSQLTESCTEPEPVSSVSNVTTAEEHVAFCLMMLSRDNRTKKEQEQENHPEEQESEYDDTDELNRSNKKKTYKCETCDKVFRSYQALGGHRASHKKNQPSEPVEVQVRVQVQVQEQETLSCVSEKRKIHKCPVCFRVFSSGQALGGHKRSHVAGSINAEASPAKRSVRKESLIDLNLPAPVEDDDVVSAVSDA